MLDRPFSKIILVASLVFLACVTVTSAAKEEKSPTEGQLVPEHFAWAYASYNYLDGPKFEAGCLIGRPGAGMSDADGNVWFGNGLTTFLGGIGGRCIMNNGGMVRRFFGDDYWTSDFDLDEGPGSALFNLQLASGLGKPGESQFVWGSPTKGEGFILFSDGGVVRKIWRNADKNNRWWFKKIIGGGKEALPRTKGGSVGARDVKARVEMMQVQKDGTIIAFCEGGFYKYKNEKLICLLGYDDYKNKDLPKGVPNLGVVGGDGTFYLGTYFVSAAGGKTPCIWQVKEGEGLRAYAWAVDNKHLDGAAMYSGGMCGHHIWSRMHNYQYLSDDCLYITAHDEFRIRRIRKGRVSTLCEDGEWREVKKVPNNFRWFHTWAPGPNGMVTMSSKMRNKHSTALTYVVKGIDWEKKTIGEKIASPKSGWPRLEGFKTVSEMKKEKIKKGKK